MCESAKASAKEVRVNSTSLYISELVNGSKHMRKGGLFFSDKFPLNFCPSLSLLKEWFALFAYPFGVPICMDGHICKVVCSGVGLLGSWSDFSPFSLCNCNDIAHPFSIISEMSIDFHGCFSLSV